MQAFGIGFGDLSQLDYVLNERIQRFFGFRLRGLDHSANLPPLCRGERPQIKQIPVDGQSIKPNLVRHVLQE